MQTTTIVTMQDNGLVRLEQTVTFRVHGHTVEKGRVMFLDEQAMFDINRIIGKRHGRIKT